MEAYNNSGIERGNGDFVTNTVVKARSWISSFFGIIIVVIAMTVIIIVASLEATKVVRASNSDSGKLLTIWREANNVTEGYPEEKADIIQFKKHDYYFMVESRDEEGEIVSWYFAFDGGFDYMWRDHKFWILTGMTIVFSLYSGAVNYNTSAISTMNTGVFKQSLVYYKGKKDTIAKFTQFIPAFCSYKYNQKYEEKKRQIVESANISYAYFVSPNFDKTKIEKWQLKRLKKIEKIKIIPLTSSDLLQEQGSSGANKNSFLPLSLAQHKKRYMFTGGVQRIITSFMSGMVMAFGFVFKEYWLGVAYAGAIAMSAISASVISVDFVSNALRNRFISKGDFLSEFDNIKGIFIKEEEERIEKIEFDKRVEKEKEAQRKMAIEQELAEKKAVLEAKNKQAAISTMVMVMKDVKFLPKSDNSLKVDTKNV